MQTNEKLKAVTPAGTLSVNNIINFSIFVFNSVCYVQLLCCAQLKLISIVRVYLISQTAKF